MYIQPENVNEDMLDESLVRYNDMSLRYKNHPKLDQNNNQI